MSLLAAAANYQRRASGIYSAPANKLSNVIARKMVKYLVDITQVIKVLLN